MKLKCAIFLVFLFVNIEAKDFVVGNRVNNLLLSTGKVEYSSIPLIRRDKDYTYIDPKLRVIKGIIARDLSRTDAEVSLVEGGVGSTNVTLHFKSERGGKLNYLVLVFGLNS